MRLRATFIAVVSLAPHARALAMQADVRDSAGVTIVHHGASTVPPRTYALGAVPATSIVVPLAGATNPTGLPARVTAVARLSGGRIAVAIAGNPVMSLFGVDGKPVFAPSPPSPAQPPLGPVARIMVFAGDSMAAFERGRIDFLDNTGHPTRVQSTQGSAIALLRGGAVVSILRGAALADTAWLQIEDPFVPGSPGFLSARRVIPMPQASITPRPLEPPRPNGTGGTAMRVRTIPAFPRTPAVLADSFGIVVADGTAYEIREYAFDARLTRIIRWDRDLAVTADDIARYTASLIASVAPEQRAGLQAELDTEKFQATFPAFTRFLLDDMGRMWAQDFVRPGAKDVRWHLFDRAGTLLGVITLPASARIHMIGQDYAIVEQQEKDGPVVRVFPLEVR
jgi:hypothetical protein